MPESVRPLPFTRRLGLSLYAALTPVFGRFFTIPWVMTHSRYYPALPIPRQYEPPKGAWPHPEIEVPAGLRTVPGIRRDPKLVEEALRTEGAVRDFRVRFPDGTRAMQRGDWLTHWAIRGRTERNQMRAAKTTAAEMPASPLVTDPTELTRLLREKAAELGLSAVGVTTYDPSLTFDTYAADQAVWGDRVVVAVVEQHYQATQTIPSEHAQLATFAGAAEVLKGVTQLAEYLHSLGYKAFAGSGYAARGQVVAYAVAAGLGQLGRNGLLLTPHSGPRSRIALLQTNAPLLIDPPVDYGVTALCDACMVCVRRCPASAIPRQRKLHRGVDKAKINAERCLPVVSQVFGCAICMKVCPVQKHGLVPVLEEYQRSGRVLGKGTDDLEGFDWIDGMHYGPGARPKLEKEFFDQPQFKETQPRRSTEKVDLSVSE